MTKTNKTNKNEISNTKSIEEQYKKLKDQHEHALKRPGMYIGSIEKETINMWIYNENRKENEPELISKEISYVPGLYKIFDEILVNARDHVVRCHEEKKEECTMIKVNIDQESGKITVWNNGAGIPVVEHKEHQMLIPSMIFGELLTSSNYDDEQKRKVGGTNGLGAKLTNIYSKEFVVETLDSDNNKKFYQKFSNNMYQKDKPVVKSGGGKKSYTQISFIPDYERFGLNGLTNDMMSLFKKRVYDIAMTSTAKVYYNDKLIAANNFAKYVDLYFPEGSEHKKVLDVADENWKVCVVYDPTDTLEHQNISFVNGICTSRGGTHVDYISNQIINKIKNSISKKTKDLTIKPSMIKENLIFFVDAVIINPEFDTQTKELLKTKVANFGSTYEAPETFLKKIIKTGVVDQIIANALAKAEANLSKNNGKKGQIRYEKLYDATKAGTKEGYKCTLILTEGDSAKAFALAGLNVISRDYYGVFPLRGKLLNVRDASPTKIAENQEITAITRIVGLEHKKVYDDVKGLRYGRIMILTDQDVDGYHIKGLIMNFIHFFWPSLIKQSGFICSFPTPIVKASKGTGKNRQVIEFTNLNAFEEWKKENNNETGWKIKYYKGLGTSTSAEAQDCFRDLDEKLVEYVWPKLSEERKKTKKKTSDLIDEENDIISTSYKPKCDDLCEDAISLAFHKKRSHERKSWINTYNPNVYIDTAQKKISYYDFIHKELISFSVYDNMRSIPNIMDGFKPSQRKVYYGSVEEKIDKEEMKVSELMGAVSKRTKYHHGDQALVDTIIGMAQNFVGSNNLNLLIPSGNFGSRAAGGKDASSPRYIFTQLDKICEKIFIDNDFYVLQHQYDDGKMIEPYFYAPIIPMILVNGAEGIGTGFSSSTPPYNIRDIIANIKRILANEKPRQMKPWYRHFTGTIEKISNHTYIARARYEIIDDDTVHISDLPIGQWTDNYKAFLDNLMSNTPQKTETKSVEKTKGGKSGKNAKGKSGKKGKFLAKKSKKSQTAKVSKTNAIVGAIKKYTEQCTDVRVSFTITFYPGKLKQLIKTGKFEKNMKLVTTINLSNMHLFDENGKIQKYNSAGAILQNYVRVRLELYQKRKNFLLGKWNNEMNMLIWKLKFVEAVIYDKIIVFKKKKSEVIDQLEKLKFPKLSRNESGEGSYDYLTSMTIVHFTTDEVEKLRKQIENKKQEIDILEAKMPTEIWNEELDQFMEAYDKWEEECDKAYEDLLAGRGHNKKKPKKKSAKVSEKQANP